ncbi:MAG: hypothetical protein ABSG41_24595 [Bryobacteraceae bacterium]
MPRRILVLLAVVLMALVAAPGDDSPTKAVRATLNNGLRVVIVRDPLAPVATLEQNYLTGGEDTPAGFPGNPLVARGAKTWAWQTCARRLSLRYGKEDNLEISSANDVTVVRFSPTCIAVAQTNPLTLVLRLSALK